MAVVFFFLPIVLSILAYRKSNEVNDQVVRLRSLIEDKGNQKDPSYSNSINQVDQQQNSTQDLTSKSPEYSQNQENITDNSINEQQVAEKDFLEVFFIWFKDNWVMKLGVLFVLVGFVTFIGYAFVVGWIGPYGKVATGFIVGIAIIIFANTRINKSINQGAPLIILAVAIILSTIYYASYVYGFFNEFISLVAVLITAAYVNVVALQHNLKSLSVVGLVISASAPLFANTNSADYVFLFSYLTVISVAHLWIMKYKNWRFLGSIASLVILLYSAVYFIDNAFNNSVNSDGLIVTSIVAGLSLLFLVTNVLNITKFKEDPKVSDGMLAVLTGILVSLWVFFDPIITSLASSTDVQSLLLAVWMIIFAIGSYFVFIKNKNLSYFYIYSAVSIVFLVIITSLQLDGAVLTFAYIFESAIISLVGYAVTSKLEIGYKLSSLMIIPSFITLQSFFSSSWRTSVFNEDFAIILSMSIVLLGVGYFYTVVKEEENEGYLSGINLMPHTIMIIAGTLFMYGLIWISLMSFYNGAQIAILIALTIYTIVGLSSYIYGKVDSRVVFKNYGLFLLVLVIARLLLVDIWNMDAIMKVATFSIIGVMFIATSFIKSDEKEREELSENNVNV